MSNRPHPPLTARLIDAETLKQWLDEQTPLVVLDCRFDLHDANAGKNAFENGHIPTADYLHLNDDLSGEVMAQGGRHPLPNLKVFANKLAGLGITPETRVIIYDDHRGAYATRAWWLLNHVGITDCHILNGGYSSWTAQAFAIENGASRPHTDIEADWFTTGRLPTVSFNHLANGHQRAETLVCDARESVRYRGEQEPIDPVAGHIPGAINAPWQQNTDNRGFFKSKTVLKTQWASILPTQPNTDPVIHYCGSGVTACVNIFSMTLAGYSASILYPGSWSDWCSHFDRNPWALNPL